MIVDTMDYKELLHEFDNVLLETKRRMSSYFTHHKKELRKKLRPDKFSLVYDRTAEFNGTKFKVYWFRKILKPDFPLDLPVVYTSLEYKNLGKCWLIRDNAKISLITTHFLKRYQERFLKKENLNLDEVIKIFLVDRFNLNMTNEPMLYSEINEDFKCNMEFAIKDGAVLGLIDPRTELYELYTFLSEEELRSDKDQVNLSLITESKFNKEKQRRLWEFENMETVDDLRHVLSQMNTIEHVDEELADMKYKGRTGISEKAIGVLKLED